MGTAQRMAQLLLQPVGFHLPLVHPWGSIEQSITIGLSRSIKHVSMHCHPPALGSGAILVSLPNLLHSCMFFVVKRLAAGRTPPHHFGSSFKGSTSVHVQYWHIFVHQICIEHLETFLLT